MTTTVKAQPEKRLPIIGTQDANNNSNQPTARGSRHRKTVKPDKRARRSKAKVEKELKLLFRRSSNNEVSDIGNMNADGPNSYYPVDTTSLKALVWEVRKAAEGQALSLGKNIDDFC